MKKPRLFLSIAFVAFISCYFVLASYARSVYGEYRSSMPILKRYGQVRGLVSTDSKDVYVISNYQSRSRVDYKVYGKLKEKIARLKGKVIIIEGKITRIGWSGTILVKKIISTGIEDKKPAYHITIVGIADLQGFLEGFKNVGGIAKIASIIKQIKQENKAGTLVVLSGDDLMGRYFHAFNGRAITLF